MSGAFGLDRALPWGRNRAEYLAFFELLDLAPETRIRNGFVLVRPSCCHRRQPGQAIWGIPDYSVISRPARRPRSTIDRRRFRAK